MSIRTTYVTQNNTTGETDDPITFDAEYDGNKFTFGPGEMKAFADDGQGIGIINNQVGGAPAAGVVQDNATSKKLNPNAESRA